MLTKIGTVEMLIMRVYPFAPGSVQDVCVQPGVYDIMTDGKEFWWSLKGNINQRVESLGDGLFVLHSADKPTGSAVEFPSPPMSRELFEDILNDPEMLKRMHFSIEKSF